ncbi:MAG: cobyrinic acid a,c-diamide synthase [Candidatus Entotheonella factor]|uniref:Cobyrinic acid a,c-diamide synthase n=1 Tax=Entotheonella factor TaxID=1429438 RepID=W4LYE4_ENTF1|nr:MAG: cobyrinic acid a,c-diamide synthase [Candidatus Entotheonella factor]
MKIVAIYHNKGGVGKTTVSINLAAGLRNQGHRVLLIDLDSQANSTFATGLVKFQFEEEDDLRGKNVRDILASGDFDFIPDIMRQSHYFNIPEIDVIPSHISLIEAQYQLNQIRASQTRLIKKLKREEDHYDFVIIDTPPSRDIYAQVAIIAANYLIIPSDMKPFANQGLSSVRSFLKEIDGFREGIGRQPIKILGVLPSKISTNHRAFENTFPRQKETIVQKYNFPVMDSIIFERAAFSHSINQTHIIGDIDIPDPKSIFAYASQHPSANQAASEFESLTAEVLSSMEKL